MSLNFKPKKIAVLDHTTPARRRVKRRVKDENGKEVDVTERIPWQRFFKAVNLAGAVVRIPVHTHRVNSEPQDQYKVYTEYTKPRKGVIPYGVCPQTHPEEIARHIPAHLLGKQPCRTNTLGGPINADQCCQCIEDLIAYRKAEQAERMRKTEIKTEAMLAAEASTQMATAVKGIADVVADLKTKVDQPSSKRQTRSVDD